MNKQQLVAWLGLKIDDSIMRGETNTMQHLANVELLAALTAEPVAWMVKDIDTGRMVFRSDRANIEGVWQPLFTRAEVLKLNAIDNTAQQYEALGKGDKC